MICPALGQASDECVSTSQSVETELKRGSEQARIWANAWGTLWAVATVGQATTAALTPSHNLRQDLAVGAAGSALGLIPTWFMRPKITHYEDDARDLTQDPCARLKRERDLVDGYIESDELNSGWTAHVGNVFLNLSILAGLGFGFGHWTAAGIGAGVGIPVGELMIQTYPRAATEIRSSYFKRPSLSWIPSGRVGTLLLSWDF